MIVVLLNVGYGIIEIGGSILSGSQALQADSLDFIGDGLISFLGLIAVGWGLAARAKAALLQGVFLALLGFGVIGSGKPDFWIGDAPVATGHLHLAFAAKDRAAVDAFYAAAIAAGARDNGAPGLRPHYHPNYYGAFVFDPDGLNVEAVCHMPETA